jgi:hypothetical protein
MQSPRIYNVDTFRRTLRLTRDLKAERYSIDCPWARAGRIAASIALVHDKRTVCIECYDD